MYMSTATINISLPGSLKKSIEERLEEERYNNPSDYIQTLVQEDLVRRDERKLEQMLLDGIESGSQELTPHDWQSLKKEILASVAK